MENTKCPGHLVCMDDTIARSCLGLFFYDLKMFEQVGTRKKKSSHVIFEHPKSVFSLSYFPTTHSFYNLDKDKKVRNGLIEFILRERKRVEKGMRTCLSTRN